MNNTLTFDTTENLVSKPTYTPKIYNIITNINYKPTEDAVPYLRQKTVEFDFTNPARDPITLSLDLMETMKKFRGIGLAAIQCGIPYRVFVLDCNMVCFNPKILEDNDDPIERKPEGCLSFPGLMIPISRPSSVLLKWFDAEGKEHTQRFTGLTARAIRHEMDHLDGIVFTDIVGNLTLQMAQKKKAKLLKKIKRVQNRILTLGK